MADSALEKEAAHVAIKLTNSKDGVTRQMAWNYLMYLYCKKAGKQHNHQRNDDE